MKTATKKLVELANIFYGASPAAIRVENSDIPIFGTSGFVGYAIKPLFETEAIVVGRKGTLSNPIFTPNKFWAIDTTYAVIAKEKIDTKWLYYALVHYDLTRLNEATGVPSINRDRLYDVDITYFEYPEQCAIADILSTLDEAIAQSESLVRKYQSIKQGLMSDVLTRGVDENGEVRSIDGNKFEETELGLLPAAWDISPMGHHVSSSAFGPRFSSTLYSDTGQIALIRTTDLDQDGNINYATLPLVNSEFKVFQYHLLEINDLMISRSGTIGIASVFEGHIYPTIPGAFLIRFRFKDSMNSQFIRRYFNWGIGRQRIVNEAAGGVQQNVTGTALLKLRIPVPSLDEQERIVSILKSADLVIQSEHDNLAKLLLLKQGLMQDLLSGQMRVSGLV